MTETKTPGNLDIYLCLQEAGSADARHRFWEGDWDNIQASDSGYLIVSLAGYIVAVYAPGMWSRYYISYKEESNDG